MIDVNTFVGCNGRNEGLGDVACDNTPCTRNCVVASIKRLCLMSTSKLKWRRKSAPKMGSWTLATIKIHLKALLSQRFKVSERFPYVIIDDPFTASKLQPSCGCLRSVRVGGSTLTSAPVSTRKR